MKITEAKSDVEILMCWEVLHELRPHLEKEKILSLIKEMMNEGYQLAFVEENGMAISAIGFRYLQFLFAGKHFYIDDLVTLPSARKKGCGAVLLDYVFELAEKNGYEKITLDSGHHRNDAHRLYLNKGFKILAHHFVKDI
ncbi:MAG: GNAT family N-acetyltransferase [Sphingobacteriales bacterium]|nr:MAG: GNAT family N-acetyltransferase [Sphingobacteriales bacterium]